MSSVPVLRSGGKAAIDKFLHESAVDDSIPAVFFGATNAKEQLYYEAEGDMVFGEPSKGQVNMETNTEMFSQTKFVTAVAAMQLVEQGKVDLDSVEDIEKYLPELGKLPILKSCNEEPVLEPAQKKITLRMLLSHTAGFVYTHSSPLTTKWAEKTKHPTLFDPTVGPEVLETPLIYEPGTSWTYSHSIDWAGVLVERISDLSLEEYFQTYIFKPCGITSMTFYPTDKIKSNKMAVCYRDGSGKVVATPGGFGMGRPESGVPKLHLGGAGLFGTQRDYLTFLRAVLQCDPKNKEYRGTNGPSKPLISPESYAELFKPSVSVGAGLDGTEKIMEMVSKPKYFDPPATKHNLNHSVGFLLNLEDWTGRRKAGSGCWSGAAKTQFWIDPVTGVAVSLRFETIADEEGICGTQLLAPSPDRWYETYVQYEKVLYENLASQ